MADLIPLVMKLDDWPPADRVAWEALFASGDLFDDTGPCAHWSAGSRRKRQQGYGQWISHLMRSDPAVLSHRPADRITELRVRTYVDECEARLAPKSTAGLILDFLVIAEALGPTEDWSWLRIVAKRLGYRANNHSLPAPHPISASEIFQWSLARMAEMNADVVHPPRARAIRFRQALLIGFLIARPVRRRALLGMLIGRHLVPGSDRYDLCFQPEDMKDRKARSFVLPRDLVTPMDSYLDLHRPELLRGKASDALWINQYGNPITPDGLSRELPKVTMRHLGVELRPHAFRHIAATSIAEADPEHVNIIRDLLGHATLDMSQKHYNRATGLSSCNGLQSIVEDIRKGMPIIGRAKRNLTAGHDVRERK